jgi:hypothetical protein
VCESFQRRLPQVTPRCVADIQAAVHRERRVMSEPGPISTPDAPRGSRRELYEAPLVLADSDDQRTLQQAHDNLRALGARPASALVAWRMSVAVGTITRPR